MFVFDTCFLLALQFHFRSIVNHFGECSVLKPAFWFSSSVSNLTSATTFPRSAAVLFPSFKARYFVRKEVRCKETECITVPLDSCLFSCYGIIF